MDTKGFAACLQSNCYHVILFNPTPQPEKSHTAITEYYLDLSRQDQWLGFNCSQDLYQPVAQGTQDHFGAK